MRSLLILTSAIIFVSSAQSHADIVSIVNINPSTQINLGSSPLQPGQIAYGFHEAHGNGLIGWGFNALQPVTVSQVGWYDDGQDGLSRPFTVGLWAGLGSSTQLLGTDGITIPASTSAALNGVWRVVDLATPLTLQPGFYVLGGLDTATTADPIIYGATGGSLPTDPSLTGGRVTFGAYFWSTSGGQNGFIDPPVGTAFPLNYGIELGPMLFISVPEPTSFVMLAIAGAALLMCQSRHFFWQPLGAQKANSAS